MLAELQLEDAYNFQKYLWIISENFEEIFQLIKDDTRKENTKMRDPFPLSNNSYVAEHYFATKQWTGQHLLLFAL